jgi:hypothetical protein
LKEKVNQLATHLNRAKEEIKRLKKKEASVPATPSPIVAATPAKKGRSPKEDTRYRKATPISESQYGLRFLQMFIYYYFLGVGL